MRCTSRSIIFRNSAAAALAVTVYSAPLFACIAVDQDEVRAKDLVAADPWFARLDPETEVGMTPLAGLTRILRSQQLLAVARSAIVSGPALPDLPALPKPDTCVERATLPLTLEQLQPVLDRANGAPLTVLEYSHYRIPRGAIEFARNGLQPSGLWKGHVAYTSNHSFPIWARIRLDGATETNAGALGNTHVPAVERGSRVRVEVTSGGARLEFEAIAESTARLGESVLLRNPESGRLFQAKVQGNRKVAIHR